MCLNECLLRVRVAHVPDAPTVLRGKLASGRATDDIVRVFRMGLASVRGFAQQQIILSTMGGLRLYDVNSSKGGRYSTVEVESFQVLAIDCTSLL